MLYEKFQIQTYLSYTWFGCNEHNIIWSDISFFKSAKYVGRRQSEYTLSHHLRYKN